jgi:hypothetical protein
MVSGSILQLVAHGVQDVYLIGNPQMTYFKTVFKRHTNFAVESIQTTFVGKANFGQKATILIPRKADLLSNLILEVDLPSISTTTGVSGSSSEATGTMKYVDNVGHALIQQADILIGDQLIDRQYGEWMDIWTLLTENDSKKETLDDMLDRTGDLNNTGGITIYIPMRFWFCRNIGLALPLIALQYHDVKVEITFRTLAEVTTLGDYAYYNATGTSGSTSLSLVKQDSVNTPSVDSDVAGKYIVTSNGTTLTVSIVYGVSGAGTVASPYIVTLDSALSSSLSSDEAYVKPNGVLTSSPVMTSARMYADYIYLDTYEKKQFALTKHRYLIEQLQYNGPESITAGLITKKFALNFNLPVKELYWTLQQDRVSLNNDLFNYSNTVAEDIVKGNMLSECYLRMNGIERFEERNADYFRLIQPYLRHNRSPKKFFYMYSFALNPEKHQPSGSSNFSKLDSASLELTMTSGNPISTLKVYALSYNILRIMDGMGGVAFSS